MTPRPARGVRTRGPLRVLLAHHREHEPHHVVVLMLLAGALSLIAAILVAGAAGPVAVASHLRHANWYWFAFAIVGAVAAHLGYVFAYREVAHVDRGVRLSTLRAGAIVTAGFGMFFPRGGFAVDLEALQDLGVPREEARIRVLGLGSLEYAVLSTGACICAILLLLDNYPAQRAVTLSWTIGVPLGTALALLAVRYRNRICRGRIGGALRPALDAIAVVGMIVASPRRHGAVAFTGMAVYWAGEVFVLWVCLAAFTQHTPSVLAVVVGYATGYALTRRTLPLAGAGAVEALLPFALTWVGFGLPAAVLAVFAYRIFNLWLPLGPAVGALYALQRRPPEVVGTAHRPATGAERAGADTPSGLRARPAPAECHAMNLRGEPLERVATLPDGNLVAVRVGLAEDSYIPRRELDTVVLELWDEKRGEHVAGVTTVLSADEVDAARALLGEVVDGLESGSLEPTAGALEPLADSVQG